jgi:hypothetical protein
MCTCQKLRSEVACTAANGFLLVPGLPARFLRPTLHGFVSEVGTWVG